MIGLQVVTMGSRASDVAREWFADNRYQDYLYLHGLSVEMAEALRRIRPQAHPRRVGLRRRGGARPRRDARASVIAAAAIPSAIPPAPTSPTSGQLLELLRRRRIGLALTDEDQLDPEQSTSAIVVHHPQAKYFSV